MEFIDRVNDTIDAAMSRTVGNGQAREVSQRKSCIVINA